MEQKKVSKGKIALALGALVAVIAVLIGVYAAFGAGVQSELEEGQTLEYDEKGNIVVSGFDTPFPKVTYVVGTVSDHLLCIEGESISLTELCGKNAHVTFELR